ncbi:response regulator transcription factor [Halalkalibacter krulwichiae]|uniref:Spore germination protein GerE n=1 Tax=Halalkalibacter krulwichiae TaxID=199441 RepID=A0A1X9MEF5_9BACI|nr:LuxR C-terminal-related transcriptional regulator [Halalkalibacter krulwichiae]ARK29921.1 Spore germination protein GerE [Halalkalibacter krulwichiae]
MIDNITLQDYIKKIEKATTNEDQHILYIRGLVELFSLRNVYLFRYSPIGFSAEGVIHLDQHGKIHTISNVQDDLRSLPLILSAIRNREAEFITTESYLTRTSNQSIPNLVSSMLIIPICMSANVVGYTVSTDFSKSSTSTNIQNLLQTVTLYGKLFGKILESNYHYHHVIPLSKREIEVMQRLAHGNSVKEMSQRMNISEHTVKDYIKSAIKKTGASNRLHATVVLLRKGIIM